MFPRRQIDRRTIPIMSFDVLIPHDRLNTTPGREDYDPRNTGILVDRENIINDVVRGALPNIPIITRYDYIRLNRHLENDEQLSGYTWNIYDVADGRRVFARDLQALLQALTSFVERNGWARYPTVYMKAWSQEDLDERTGPHPTYDQRFLQRL